jgi:hypothetical protein
MENTKCELLRDALSRDLSPAAAKDRVPVVDDTVRKVFTANKDGAVLVFGHNQPDSSYWNGVKHYGSGPSSRIRIRRTPSEQAKPAKAKRAARQTQPT